MALGLCLRKPSFAACLPDVYTPENLNAPQTSTPWDRKNTFQKFSGVIYILKVGSEAATFSQTNVYKFEFELSSPLVFQIHFGTCPF